MSVGIRSLRFPSLSTLNINEPSTTDITASLHRNVLSLGVRWGQEAKATVSLRGITQSASFPTTHSGLSNLFRAASIPNEVGRSPHLAFSSITITARKFSPSPSMESLCSSTSTQLPETFGRGTLSSPTMRVSNSQLDMCRQNPNILMENEFRRASSAADGLPVWDPRKRKSVQHRLSNSEEDRNQEVIGGPVMNLFSSQASYRSCIHHEVPLRSTSSVVFLDKSLCISLVELEGRRAGQPTLYRSALSVRLVVSSGRRSTADNKPAKTNEGYRKVAMLGSNKRNGCRRGLGHRGGPLSKLQGSKVEQTASAHGVSSKADGSETQCHSATLRLLSFRGPSPSNTKAGRQKENADEAVFSTRSNSRHRQRTLNTSSVDTKTRIKRERSDSIDKEQEDGCSRETHTSDKTCLYHSRQKADSLEGMSKTLSLKEALELFRPDFISRSQGRVRMLEQRAKRRKALQDSNPDLVQGLREDRGKQKRNCTTPDPLSDNLFKPRERSISGREMQLRSRRIYNKLPEVTKKKEEEKKRTVSQTNRLRAEVFKKRLLDQILQR